MRYLKRNDGRSPSPGRASGCLWTIKGVSCLDGDLGDGLLSGRGLGGEPWGEGRGKASIPLYPGTRFSWQPRMRTARGMTVRPAEARMSHDSSVSALHFAQEHCPPLFLGCDESRSESRFASGRPEIDCVEERARPCRIRKLELPFDLETDAGCRRPKGIRAHARFRPDRQSRLTSSSA